MNNAIQQMISDGIKVFAYEPSKNTPPDNFKLVYHWDKIDTLNQGAKISDDLNYSVLPDFKHVDLDFDCQTAKDNSFAYFNPSYLFGRSERGHMLQVISNPTPFSRIQVSFGSKVLIEMRGERNYSVAQGRLDNLGRDNSNAYSKKTDYGKPMTFEECKRKVFEVGLICQLHEGYYGSVNDYIIPIVGELLFKRMKIDHTKEIISRFLRAINRSERVDETNLSIDSMYKKNNPSKLERLADWSDTQRAQVRNSIKEVLGNIEETKTEEKKTKFEPLVTKSLKEINNTEYPELLEIVKDILCPGLWFFSAKPKVGKSFLGLSLAYSVATGQKFLGLNTLQGSCLYIAYEDSEPRISRRSSSMDLEDSDSIEFAFKTNKLMDGLEEQLIAWIELKKQNGARPLLIIIDTYIRAQDGKKGDGNNSYEIDSNKLDRLQQEILSREVCCMFITHDKKVEEGDKLNNMSGSMTFQGQDGVWRMDKNRTDGTMNSVLSIFPRDLPDQQFEVHFNKDLYEWENIGTPEVKTMDRQTRLITEAVEKISESMGDAKPKEVIAYLFESNLLEDNDRNKWAYTKKIASMKKRGTFVVGERYGSVKIPSYVFGDDTIEDNEAVYEVPWSKKSKDLPF